MVAKVYKLVRITAHNFVLTFKEMWKIDLHIVL